MRVLPQADDTEALRLDLHLDREQLDVEVAPRTPGRVLPIRVQLPSLLDGLPSIDGRGRRRRRRDDRPSRPPGRGRDAPAPAAVALRSATSAAARTERSTRGRDERLGTGRAGSAASRSRSGTETPLPTGVAPAAGTVLAVLAALGFRRSAQPSLIVHAAQRRVPVAPAIRPSFTPD